MAGMRVQGLVEALETLTLSCSRSRPAVRPRFAFSAARRRSMATEASAPASTSALTSTPLPASTTLAMPKWSPDATVPVTIYAFPSMEPRALESWSTRHLLLPLRRDLLHRAVIFEGDATRQGTASSKTRWDVAGSHRKLYPQKGSGRARVGSRQSPLRRGGGKSFGPHPRDFSSDLPRKIYDKAWRTALSYRYRRGELFVVEDGLDLPLPDDFLQLAERGRLGRELEDAFVAKAARQVLAPLEWGRAFGRTLFVTRDRRPNLFTALEQATAEEEARALELADVDVKDLLETGRVVVERTALREMIEEHQSDLVSKIVIHGQLQVGPPMGEVVIE